LDPSGAHRAQAEQRFGELDELARRLLAAHGALISSRVRHMVPVPVFTQHLLLVACIVIKRKLLQSRKAAGTVRKAASSGGMKWGTGYVAPGWRDAR
jgi:hypothetical protein